MRLKLIAEVLPEQPDPIPQFFEEHNYLVNKTNDLIWFITYKSRFEPLIICLGYSPRSKKLLFNCNFQHTSKLSLLQDQLIEEIENLINEVNLGDLSKLPEIAGMIEIVENRV